MNFNEKLTNAMKMNQSLLCIGLDPDPELMREGMSVSKFNKAIIEATADLVCAYKLNLAFYEVLDKGMESLKRTINAIPKNIPIIGDGKRGDIGNTAKAYAKAMFSTPRLRRRHGEPLHGLRFHRALYRLLGEGGIRPLPHLQPRRRRFPEPALRS